MPLRRDDFARALGVPWFVSWHAQPLYMSRLENAEQNRVKSIKQANRPIGIFYRPACASIAPEARDQPDAHRLDAVSGTSGDSKFRCYYNCLCARSGTEIGTLTRSRGQGPWRARLARTLPSRSVAAEDGREPLGLGDQGIDQRRHRLAMRHDEPDRMGRPRARRSGSRAPSRSGRASRPASPA